MSLVHDLVQAALDDQVPASVTGLLRGRHDARAASRFAAGAIVMASDALGRAYVADSAGALRPQLVEHLGADIVAATKLLPDEARLFADIGPGQVTLFGDDLYTVPDLHPSLRPPSGWEPMCASWSFPGGTSTVSRHGPPPRHLLSVPWQRRVDDLLHAGLVGLWAVRWREGQVASLVWVNDARWRGDPELSARVLDRRAGRRWADCRERAARDGLVAYPDALELHDDGDMSVTVGIVDPERADRPTT